MGVIPPLAEKLIAAAHLVLADDESDRDLAAIRAVKHDAQIMGWRNGVVLALQLETYRIGRGDKKMADLYRLAAMSQLLVVSREDVA